MDIDIDSPDTTLDLSQEAKRAGEKIWVWVSEGLYTYSLS